LLIHVDRHNVITVVWLLVRQVVREKIGDGLIEDQWKQIDM